MKIIGTENMSGAEIARELERGGRFVLFTYCISIVVMTFKPSSAIYFVKPGESPIKYGWPFLLISLIFGWWGIPWGPVYTIQAIYKAFAGPDVTADVLNALQTAMESEELKRS